MGKYERADYQLQAASLQVERSKLQKFIFPCGLLLVAFLGGCHGGLISSAPTRAEAYFQVTETNAINGQVIFSPVGSKVRMIAELKGLSPGPHAFHIHEIGDCSAADGSKAGPHFNPDKRAHGNPDSGEHHAGDLPQLIADANGIARLTAYLDEIEIALGERGVIGRSLVVHADTDNFKTQPMGNSGVRRACAVILEQ